MTKYSTIIVMIIISAGCRRSNQDLTTRQIEISRQIDSVEAAILSTTTRMSISAEAWNDDTAALQMQRAGITLDLKKELDSIQTILQN